MLFLAGANCALNFIAALLFLRFHRKTRDRLFLFFAAAFSLFAISRIVFFLLNVSSEDNTSLYAIRLAGFLLILLAILDKNRSKPASPANSK